MCDQCGCAGADSSSKTFQERVQAAIDEIRPALQGHGGDIELISVEEDNTVKVKLQGACSGCPGAAMTMKNGVERVLKEQVPEVKEVVDGPSITEFQHLVRRIPVAEHISEYAAALVRATRPDQPEAPEFVKKYMAWGAGPRASINLILAGKARAALRGRCHVAVEDIRELCLPILRHRIIPNFAARSEGMTSDTLITRLLDEIPADEKLYKRKCG